MKVLYAYRYGIIGGVSTQLLLRRAALKAAGIRCELFFSQDNGLGHVLTDRDGIHFGKERSFGHLVRQGVYDAVIVIDSPELLHSARGPFYRRNPVLLDVHTTVATGLAYLSEISPSRLAAVMVPTRYSKNLVTSRLPSSTSLAVIPNILDTELFTPAASPLAQGERQFIWVGKLDLHKNWRLAVTYIAMLRKILGRPVRLHMVGGYAAQPALSEAFFKLIHKLGVSDCVTWIDRIENAELADLYRQCAASGGAMLVTSRDESFGMAAAEAVLCGCPLITNDLPVFREVFPESRMIQRVDIWQPERVARAAEVLAQPPSTEEVDVLRQELSRRYGPHAFVEAFKKLMGTLQ